MLYFHVNTMIETLQIDSKSKPQNKFFLFLLFSCIKDHYLKKD